MKAIVLFTLLVIFARRHFSLDFEPTDIKAGLTFVKLSGARISYDTYTILYYVDIAQYKNITQMVKKFLDYAKQENDKMEWSSKSSYKEDDEEKVKMGVNAFYTMLGQAEVLLGHMMRDEADIEAYQQREGGRNKRAIEFVGDFLNYAFGTLNADAAREYDRKIENMHNDSSRIHNLLNEQTVLIKESLALNNKSQADLRKQLNKIAEKVELYNDESYSRTLWMDAQVAMLEGITMIKMLESEHQRLTSQIIGYLEDTVSGKITQLIPKDRLTNDLVQVSKFLKEDQKLPIDFMLENPLHIFKYAKIVSTLYGSKIMMEVSIPIVERGVYTVYEIIPIPAMVGNSTVVIKPSTRYVLMNDGQKEFIPITPREYFKSRFNLRGERIIKPAENAVIDYSQNCEISIMMHPKEETLIKYCEIRSIPTSNYFISINSNDAFYLRITKPLLITEYCRHKPAQPHEIKESGILIISKECRVVTDRISLRPRNNYKYDSKQIITLANHTMDITFKAIAERVKRSFNVSIARKDDNILIQDSSNDFDMLIEKANKLIEKTETDKKWNDIQYATVHASKKSYGFTTLMTIIILVLIIVVIWYLYKKFFSVETWIKLADELGRGNVDRVPQLFIKNF